MLNLEIIGKKITTLRKSKALTQNDLAERLFVTHQAVSKWENGKSIPSIELLYEMTKLFDVSIDYLLDHSEIDPSDYESRFKHQPREIVISSYLKSNQPNHQFSKVFYLLNKEERSLLLSLIVNKTLSVDVDVAWPYLNNRERKYLLGAILTGKIEYDLTPLLKHLKIEEIEMIEAQLGYNISNTHNYIIRSEKNEKRKTKSK